MIIIHSLIHRGLSLVVLLLPNKLKFMSDEKNKKRGV